MPQTNEDKTMTNYTSLQLFALANTDKTMLETVMMWNAMHDEALAMNEAFDAAHEEAIAINNAIDADAALTTLDIEEVRKFYGKSESVRGIVSQKIAAIKRAFHKRTIERHHVTVSLSVLA